MPKLYPNWKASIYGSLILAICQIMFGQFGQKQYYNVGGPGGPPNRGGGGGGGMNNQMPFDEQEKAARSVFVGNIPYEATEEQLKAIFTEIGVVMSFRLVYDRETGKPKGTISIILSG